MQSLHNLNIERAVLSTLLFGTDQIGEICTLLEPGVFFAAQHQRIYEAIRELHNSDHPIDEVFVQKKLNFDPQYEEVLLDILAASPLSNALAYCSELL
jgi:replicative DNA helicase